MPHEIHQVTACDQVGTYSLKICFEDGSSQVVDFQPVLVGELFGPLADPALFAQFSIDPESATLIWPNGADFDPDTLYHWPTRGKALAELAKSWLQRAS